MKTSLISFSTVIMISSCGVKMETRELSPPKDTDLSSTHEPDKHSALGFDRTEISGFIVSAFTVTVDGVVYSDLEQFYSRSLQRLPALVKAAGYDETYKVSLQAEIGFKDLWNGMDVFVLANAKNGYQAHTFVDSNGGFKTFIPKESADVEYKIRGVKRIGVTVTKDAVRKFFCYNFSAKEQSAHFGAEPNPVIVNEFVTELTAYKCDESSATGFTFPPFG